MPAQSGKEKCGVILDFPDLTEEYVSKLDEFVNNEEKPVVYLAIDPGVSNGVTGYSATGQIQFMTTINEKELLKFLRIFKKINTLICEDYRIREDKAKHHIGSDVVTLRVIGRIENWCEVANVVLVKQMPTIKSIGYKWLGKKPLPKHNPANHKWDAHVHFIYWGVRKGIINLKDLL